ncbi:MAG: hypothetical protein ACRD0O_11225, partial [Acidimicrobiia bacterium]
ALVAAVVVMGAAVGRLTGAGPAGVLPEEAEVPVSAEIGFSPAPPSALKPLAEGWRLVRKAPIASRHGALSTWTGERLLIWGGMSNGRKLDDGAAYDPDTDHWRLLPPAPLSGHVGLTSVWTGREWIIWGSHIHGAVPGEGVAYDPDTGAWRRLPPAPLRSSSAQAVWTGREMLLWGGAGGAAGAAYAPDTDRWRRIARGGPDDVAAPPIWTGGEMVVMGFVGSAAYDPETDRWRPLPLPPVTPWITRNVVWTGNELLAVGGTTEAGPAADAAAYDPAANRWRRLASAPDPIDVSDATATWTGRLLVMARGPSRLQIYDPARDVWSETPGLLDGPRVGSVAVWTGKEMVFWGGYGVLGTPAVLEEGVAWRP